MVLSYLLAGWGEALAFAPDDSAAGGTWEEIGGGRSGGTSYFMGILLTAAITYCRSSKEAPDQVTLESTQASLRLGLT